MMFTRIITGLSRSLRENEFTVAQIAALHVVDQQGMMRVSALAEELGLSASAASRLIEGLVQRGLLARAEDPADRRAKMLTLSADGRRFVEQTSAERLRVIEETAQGLPTRVLKGLLATLRGLKSQ